MRNWTCWICDGTQVCLDHKRRWYLNLAYNWKYKLARIKKWVSYEINQHWTWLSNWVVESVVARQWPGKGDMTSRSRMDGFSSDLKETLDCPLEIHKVSTKESPPRYMTLMTFIDWVPKEHLGNTHTPCCTVYFPIQGPVSPLVMVSLPSLNVSHRSQTRQHSTMEPIL